MNKTILIGRLTRDPEMRYANNNNLPIVKFSLAVDRRFKKDGQPDVDFINHIAFGKTAEFINNYFTKGRKIATVGRIQVSSWEDESGKKNYKTEIVTDEAYFVDSKSDNKTNPSDTQTDYAPIDDDDDELPF